jgi:hypothetical protein
MQFFWHEGGPDFKVEKVLSRGWSRINGFCVLGSGSFAMLREMFHDFLMQDTSWETETRERKLLWSQNFPFLLSVPAVDI